MLGVERIRVKTWLLALCAKTSGDSELTQANGARECRVQVGGRGSGVVWANRPTHRQMPRRRSRAAARRDVGAHWGWCGGFDARRGMESSRHELAEASR